MSAITAKLEAAKAAREKFERDYHQELESLKAQEAALLKVEEQKENIIKVVTKLGIDPVLLGEILMDAGLIDIEIPEPVTHEKGSVAPKYRHPEDHSKTWSGRGKRPVWITEYLGGDDTKLSALLIENQDKEQGATVEQQEEQASM